MSASSQLSELLSPWNGQNLAGWTRSGAPAAPVFHLLHGNGFCASTLLPFALQLPEHSELLLTDVPGHGRSPNPNHQMPDWQAMAALIGDGLQQRAGQPVIGIGHSMGGVLTLLLAAARPELFSRIILLDPVLFSPEVLLFQQVARKTGLWKRTALVKNVAARRRVWPDVSDMRADLQRKSLYRRWQPEALQAFLDGGTEPHPDGVQLSCDPNWEASIFGSYPRGLWHAVHNVSVPVDILVASDSYGFIERAARRAAKANRNIRWQSVEGSHCFPMEEPAQAASLVMSLLTERPEVIKL